MIHFTCDGCGRTINPNNETRFVVRMEVYAAVEDEPTALADEPDHLEEIEDLLERMDDLDNDVDEQLYRMVRHDLCSDCRERLLSNPLGRATVRSGYSDN
ncbi:MAG: hypothetical protein AAF266_11610 [Planctomycetota bacterium]